MSYDVSLRCHCCGRSVLVESHSEGGTFAVGGTNSADLNITYNYYEHFCRTLGEDGIWQLHDQRAGDWIERLEKAVETLGTKRHDDYWKSTKGNAGYALSILLRWAKRHPEAIFEVR